MITTIHLHNFKCFEDIELSVNNLTLLTGINGTGKSTVLQSLMLLKQSFLKDDSLRTLFLNDENGVRLGTGEDVLYSGADEENIGFSYDIGKDDEKNAYDFKFALPDDGGSDRLESLLSSSGKDMLVNNSFRYLSADRITPQRFYRLTDMKTLEQREFGANGEFSVQYLLLHGDDDIYEKLKALDGPENMSLRAQVAYWLGKISNSAVPIINVDNAMRTAELKYEFIQGTAKSNTFKSMNVGFGITYTLPFIVLLLSARPGDILLIENPEAHLHPEGQRFMGELISLVATAGIQVFVESHSDHILNGIRVSVKNGIIDNNKVNLLYFYQEKNEPYRHSVKAPRMLPDGKLDMWPVGFFDEWEKAMMDLL